MAKANQPVNSAQETTSAIADAATVTNLGDVTEARSAAPSIESGLIAIHPMSKLPKSHKGLAQAYPGAKGFTEESGSIALHF